MIEELSYRDDCDRDGNCYGVIPPSRNEIINKINEIIQHLNKKDKEKTENVIRKYKEEEK